MLRAMHRRALVVALVACGQTSKPTETVRSPAVVAAAPVAKPPPAPPTPPELRLPALAKPTRHVVELTIDPTREDFAGTITSELQILAATNVLWLNGLEIEI